MPRLGRTLATAALALGVAAPANASTLQFDYAPVVGPDDRALTAYYAADPGETNSVTFRTEQTGVFLVKDPGATIRQTQGNATVLCVSGALGHELRCTAAPVLVGAGLGDRNDSAGVLGATYGRLDGGPGNDRLTLQQSRFGWMIGGSGNDTLTYQHQGGFDPNDPGPPVPLYGGDGHDVLQGSGVSDLHGGPGSDRMGGIHQTRVHYEDRPAGVRVTLDGVSDDGGPGEGDNVLPGVHQVEGSTSADTLIGSTGDETLVGNGGDDILEGRDGNDDLFGWTGNDELVGGDGADVLLGGDGDDEIYAIDGFPDRLSCDAGTADYAAVDAIDTLRSPCDTVFTR